MGATQKVKCPWCQKERDASLAREKSDCAIIVVRRCSDCGNVISAYLDEEKDVLAKVRTFPNSGAT